jgi:hypothetical protein
MALHPIVVGQLLSAERVKASRGAPRVRGAGAASTRGLRSALSVVPALAGGLAIVSQAIGLA